MLKKISKENTGKEFYKCKLMPCEDGLSIFVQKYISVHETPCFHFCAEEHHKGWLASPLKKDSNESNIQALRRMKVKIYRVAKEFSRIAFDTEQKAYENLLFLKRRQLIHLKRDIEFINTLVDYGTGKQFKDIPLIGSFKTVPDSQDLVREHYVFD